MEIFRVFLYLITNAIICASWNCDRKPEGAVGQKGDPDTKFRIIIDEEPAAYTPEKTYKVILQATRYIKKNDSILFNGFTLMVDTVDADKKNITVRRVGYAGLFKPERDTNAKLSEICPNMVVHRSHMYVPKVEVSWIAPSPGSGCVVFKAAVMEQNAWYMDDKGLTLEFCEETNVEEFETVDPCCACSEATYEMKFQGLWTRQSHPKGFPQDHLWSIRFSDIIAVSHNISAHFWKPNQNASEGLINFCEEDISAGLESEIKKNSGIRTVIKAKGLSYPHITGKTFAIFRVDPIHHLLSVVSMIRPTPDWFVGISGLELCESTCSWVKHREVNLWPWDLGIYDDDTFKSKSHKTEEQQPIFRIQPNNMSPFYDESEKEIKPLARLHLTFQKQYDRECFNSETATSIADEQSTATASSEQITTETKCNKPLEAYCDCKNMILVLENQCTKQVTRTSFCKCNEMKECNTTDYSPVTSCSMGDRLCGKPVKVQFRNYLEPEVAKGCQDIPLQRVTDCDEDEGTFPCNRQELENICAMSPWSSFSPCTPTTNCTSVRTRKMSNQNDHRPKSCAQLPSVQTVICDLTYCNSNEMTQQRQRRKS